MRLVDHEMHAILAGPLGVIANRRNTLTRTCRIPSEILGQIFLHYKRTLLGSCLFQKSKERRFALYGTMLWWVPAVAHVCRHWRTVAFQTPKLWTHIALHLGRTCALRMLTLSRALPITIAMNDPHPCEGSIVPVFWGWFPKRGPLKLDPIYVLSNHLFHIQNLELGACSCTARRWVRLLETSAPLLETVWMRINSHRPDSRRSSDLPVALPCNFLATHPRLRRVIIENAFFSSWSLGIHPPSQLVVFSITAPNPNQTSERSLLALPTHRQLLDCFSLMPALEELALEHCLPFYYLNRPLWPRPVSLPRLRALTLQDHSDRCYQMLMSLSIPPTTTVKALLWNRSPLPNLRFLLILLPLLPQLSFTSPAIPTGRSGMLVSVKGGPRALSLSSTHDDGNTIALSVWHKFTPPSAAVAREEYAGPLSTPDVRLDYKRESGDTDMEHRALLRACMTFPLVDLQMLSVRAEASRWSALDLYMTFAACPVITHVLVFGGVGERLLSALEQYAGTGGAYSPTLFPELASLTLVGIDFVRMDGAASRILLTALRRRQTSCGCVKTLNRIELRKCVVKKEMVALLIEFSVVVVWDKVTGP